ncbi:MAG: ribosomal RNA small subunit methyltransferase B [Candidatus Binatia bacterium]|nr:MAG: ribosomal RNA small subunit methyltransferase B [Candidatus Binatia bacterium]
MSAPRTPPPPDPRGIAWQVLRRVEAGAYSDVVLGQTLARVALLPKDRALTVRLVYGTLAWQLYLDHLLAGFTHRPLADLDSAIRILLRLAMFQICFLDKVPTFAAVDTAVRLAKGYRHGAATSFVNAVLRRAAEGWKSVPLPARDRDPIGYLSVRYSHPRWIVETWMQEYGAEATEALLRANNEPAPTVLRANRLRTTRDALITMFRERSLDACPGQYAPESIVVSGFDPLNDPLYRQGLYSLQGEAAQLVGYLLNPQPGESVLDLCAAPGGKTTHLAELMHGRGRIVAVDTQRKGLDQLRRECNRLGIDCVAPYVADARTWQPKDLPAFDRVLVDAPCSGLGTLRQHPEIRWRRTPASVRELSRLQRDLLAQAAKWVRPGGVLLYVTCTMLRAENEEVVTDFLGRERTFTLERPDPSLPPSAYALIDSHGFFRTAPHLHGLDGFFAARLRRSDGQGNVPA